MELFNKIKHCFNLKNKKILIVFSLIMFITLCFCAKLSVQSYVQGIRSNKLVEENETENTVNSDGTNGIDNSSNTINTEETENPDKTDEELEEEYKGFNLSLTMYDSTIGEGREQIVEDNWNATTDSTRLITVQANLRNDELIKSYKPGELQIKVNNLGVIYPTDSTGTAYGTALAVGADIATEEIKEYDWSYSFDKESQQYIFTNNNTIEAEAHFETTIQLVYQFTASYLLNDSHIEIRAILNDYLESSNKLNFNFTSTEKPTSISLTTTKLRAYDGLPENREEFIWVKYNFNGSFTGTGVRSRTYDNYVIVEGQENCTYLNSSLQPMEVDEDGNYRFENTSSSYYIGYPKSIYDEQTVSSAVHWYGKYKESYYYNGPEKEVRELATNTKEINLSDFIISFEGNLYSLSKSGQSGKKSHLRIMSEDYGEDLRYYIYDQIIYYGKKYDARIGDDLLYITDENGEYRRLNDNEYYFKNVYYYPNYFKNANNQVWTYGKYQVKLFVRFAGETEYVQYGNNLSTTSGSKTITFKEDERVVGWYFEFYDLIESMFLDSNSIQTVVNVQTNNNIDLTGEIYNFNYLQVFEEDEEGNKIWKNPAKLDNYQTGISKDLIAASDLETYGNYVQRALYKNNYYEEDYMNLKVSCSLSDTGKNSNYFYRQYSVTANISNSETTCSGAETFNGYRLYILIPEGIEINCTKEDILNNFTNTYNNKFKRIDEITGEILVGNETEYKEFIKERTRVDIFEKYQGTDKTCVSITVDYDDLPFNSYYLSTNLENFKIPVRIPYESYYLYGNSYSIRSYITFLHENEFFLPYSKTTDTIDIDNDGSKEDFYTASTSASTTIIPAVSSYQDIKKFVKTEHTNGEYVSGTALIKENEEYSYKFRVKTGINRISNLVLYDNLEDAVQNSWKGIFKSVDISFATKQKYNIKVWCSNERDPGSLTETPDLWFEYDETLDNSAVKSIAFDFGNSVIPASTATYVVINMKAPEKIDTLQVIRNRCHTNWDAISVTGEVIDNVVGVKSNLDTLALAGAVDDLKVCKIWDDNNNELGLRPESITANLLRNGEPISEVTLNEENNWEYVFEDLPIFDENEVLFNYEIQETTDDEFYRTKIEEEYTDPSVGKVFVITNKISDKARKDFSGTKVWNDEDNLKGKRPESITINLLRDGEIFETTTTSEEQNWEYKFESCPVYKNRNEKYEYTIAEEPSIYYETNIKDEGTSYSNGLEIKFSDQCQTESVTYDWVEIYYKLDNVIYKVGKWGGTGANNTLANLIVKIPTNDFYLYWRTDGSVTNWGFAIDSIESISDETYDTATVSTLPPYTAVNVSGDNFPESKHDYGNLINKVWHYTNIDGKQEQKNSINNTYKKIDTSVLVHHYFEGTTTPVSNDVTINGLVWDEYTTSPATDIPEYYELVEMPENASGEFTEEQIEVTYYYKYKKYNYKVEYYYDGVIDNNKGETIEASYDDEITAYTDKNIPGYRLMTTEEGQVAGIEDLENGVVNLPLKITENEETNKIKVYYVKDQFDYKVEYYYDGEIDNSKTDTIEATYQDVISTYTDKNINGYRLMTTEEGAAEGVENLENGVINLPLTITENEETNIIKVYYVKNQFNYKVEYYYNGKIDNAKTETKEATYQDVITTYTDKNIIGYKFDNVDNLPLTISENSDNNVIKVYYVKDVFGYKVEYYYDGEIDNSKTEVIEATYQDEITTYTDKNIAGYKLEKTENLPLTVSENSGNNVIKVYYIKDKFNYTVEYYYDGKIDNTKTETKEATYQDVINTYNDKKIIDYVFEKTENLPLTVSEDPENNVIKVYYIKDVFSYKVEYYYDGEIDNSKTENVEVSSNTIIDTYQDKNIVGYKLDKVENLPLTVTTNSEENVIKVYYVKDKFNYTVEYYYNGKIDDSKTETIEATYKDIITTYPDKRMEGFTLDKTENLPLTVSELPATNIIKVYYVTGKYQYTVEYYYDEVKDKDKTENYEAEFGEEITSFVDKPIYGYKYDRVYNMPLTITEDPYLNIIRVYYVRKDAQITIKYVDKETGEEISDYVIVTGKVFDEHDTEQNKKEIEGYTLIEEPDPRVVTFTEKDQTVVFYYSKNTEVIVKYLEKDDTPEDNTDNLSLSEDVIINGIEGEEYTTDQKEIDNYTFVESTDNTSGKMTREPIVVIYYYLQNTRVIVNHIDKNTNENLDTVIQEGKVGDVYTASAKDFDGYVLVEKPEEETVTMTKDEIILNYYYVHISAGVVEKHINIKTDELLYSQLHEGNEGDPYSTSSKEFEGFDIITNAMYYTAHPELLEENEVSTVEELLEKLDLKADEPYIPENYEGIMTIEPIEVKYYYIRKTSVKVEYIDKITGEKLPELVEDTENTDIENPDSKPQYKEVDSTEYFYGYEGDPYKTEEKTFEGYDLIEVPENAEGTMEVTKDEDGNIVTETKVTYYYAHKAEVIEKHIDIKTDELLEDETIHTGHEGDKYSIDSKDFEGYDLVEEKLPDNNEGTMTIEPIIVEYYYIRKASVRVEYIDKFTGEKIPEFVEDTSNTDSEEKTYIEKDSTEHIYGHEGDPYKTEEKEFEGYDLIEVPENKEGTMEITIDENENVVTETVVTYYYARPAKVIEKHIDASTGELLERETVYEGHEGDPYKTSSKDFQDFELVKEKLPQNAEGTMTKEPIEVKYYYIRKVKVIVEHLEIGTEKKLAEDETIDGHEGDRYYTNSKNINGFKLLTDKIPSNKDGVMQKHDIVVKYYYEYADVKEQKNPTPITPSTPTQTKTPTNTITPTTQKVDNTNTTKVSKTTPNTGDIIPVATIGTILAVSLLNIGVTVIRKRKARK